MLVLGEYTYTDWRGVTPDMIDEAIKRIHDHCGLVGIAHPFALSNPVNTGSVSYTHLDVYKRQPL